MPKNLTEQIEELQSENERLKELEKLFLRAVKTTFGADEKTIRKALKEYNKDNA